MKTAYLFVSCIKSLMSAWWSKREFTLSLSLYTCFTYANILPSSTHY